MKSYFSKRQQLKQDYADIQKRIREVNGNLNLSDTGKAEEVSKVSIKYTEKLQAAANESAAAFKNKQAQADKYFNKICSVDMESTQRAALELGPVIAGMDYDGLLRLHNARAENPAERNYIEKVAQVRIDSDKHSGALEGFAVKFGEAKQRVYDNLPGIDDLRFYQGEADYLKNLTDHYNNGLEEMNGKPPKGAGAINRNMIEHNIELYERDYTDQRSTEAISTEIKEFTAKIQADREKLKSY